jgi:hypothetical protein
MNLVTTTADAINAQLVDYNKDIAARISAASNALTLVSHIKNAEEDVMKMTLKAPTSPLVLYKDATNTRKSGNIVFDAHKYSVSIYKIDMDFDPEGKTLRAYKQALKRQKKTPNELTLIEFLLSESKLLDNMLRQIGVAMWTGKANANSTSETLEESGDGWCEIARKAALAGLTPAPIVTGAPTKTNTVNVLENMFEAARDEDQESGVAIITPFKTYNYYGADFRTKFGNALVEEILRDSTYTGAKFHMHGNVTKVVPVSPLKKGVMMTPLKNLEYLYNEESLKKALVAEKDKFNVWVGGKYVLGAGIDDLSKVYLNDDFITG